MPVIKQTKVWKKRMESRKREQCVSRIVSGVFIVNYEGKNYFINPPSTLDKYIAEITYQENLEKCISQKILLYDEFVDMLIIEGLWSKLEEEQLEALPKLLEEAKIQLYQAYANFKRRDHIRKRLSKLKKEEDGLTNKKNILRIQSAEGTAESFKNKYIICCNIQDENGNKRWSSEDYYKQDENLINAITREYMINQLTESEIREISRTEPWRGFWNTGKSEGGVFGKCSSLLTREQRGLISWSRIYDSIHESPDAPTDAVIEDDDMLDGWLISQSRERDKEKASKGIEKTGHEGADEVYMFADTSQDASRIYAMNDAGSRGIVRNRQKQMDKNKKGLREEETLDAQMKMRKQATEQFKGKFRGQ